MKLVQKSLVLLTVGLVMLALVATADAQGRRGGGQGRGNRGNFGFGGIGGGGSSYAGLLRNRNVQEELELVDDQVEEIETISREQTVDFREIFGGLREVPEEEREEAMAKARQRVEEAQAAQDKEIADVLLPHQRKRLQQIQFQSRLRGGLGDALTQDPIAEQLDVTEPQKEKVETAQDEAQEELQAKIEQLRKEADEKVLGVLSRSQQTKFKELSGEPFDFGRGGGFGAFGGGGGGQRQFGRQGRGNRGDGGNNNNDDNAPRRNRRPQ